jgi:hypothetical protein
VTVVLDAGPEDLIGTVGHVTVIRARRRGHDPRPWSLIGRSPALPRRARVGP